MRQPCIKIIEVRRELLDINESEGTYFFFQLGQSELATAAESRFDLIPESERFIVDTELK